MSEKQGPVGIIGFGVFGRFMTEQLSSYVDVVVSSRDASGDDIRSVGGQPASLAEAAACPVVVPCVPVQYLEEVLTSMVPHLSKGGLVADVSSVKMKPVEYMKRILPADTDILATHPLFGPQSGAQGIAGLPMVVWPVRVSEERYGRIKDFLEDILELELSEVSPEEHDREMAFVHALTFFLGKALGEIDIPDTPLKTKTYQHLLDVRHIVEGDTPELFETIQLYNPFAEAVRARFTQHLDDIEAGLKKSL